MGAAERVEHNPNTPWWGEHEHRYLWAKSFVQPGWNILDIATGNGFGAAMLADAQPGVHVLGGDIDKTSLQLAAKTYKRSNLQFKYLDATALEVETNSLDMLVSFETLEHVPDANKMCQELNRVLKPNGWLLLSTPNFLVNSPSGKITNPYHVHEYVYDELLALMQRHFANVQLFGQQYARYKHDNAQGWPYGLAQGLEKLMLKRGVRKLPLGLRNVPTKLLISKPLYPQPSDYRLVTQKADALKCLTFLVLAHGRA